MIRIILILLLLGLSPRVVSNNYATTKKERNLISKGNEQYINGNYKEAVNSYRNALAVNPLSQVAEFNLSSALINLPEKDYDKKGKKPINEAVNILKQLLGSNNKNIVMKALYNLGNISFNDKDYASSIDYYKKVLRLDPNNDKARKYLRMAQLKQEQSNKNKDKQQNKEENKEQNETKNKSQQQEQNNSNQSQNNQTQSRDSIKAEQENINDVNAERILKSIENKEQETLMRIHQRNKKTQRTDKNASSRYIEKPW